MNFKCFVFGHKYTLSRVITTNVREMICLRCKMEFAENAESKEVIPLTDYVKEVHGFILGDGKTSVGSRHERREQKKLTRKLQGKKKRHGY